jgi:DNA repair photolyase
MAGLQADPVQPLLVELLDGIGVGDSLEGFTLVHLEVDEAPAYHFEGPPGRLEISIGPRDDHKPRFAATASFNVSYIVSRSGPTATAREARGARDARGPGEGRSLGPEAAALLRAVLARLSHHDGGKVAERMRSPVAPSDAGEVRATRVDSLLCPAEADGVRFYTVNPYVGCLIGCGFCYAQTRVALVRRLMAIPELPWGRYVLYKENAAEVLARELDEKERLPVVFTPLVADVYQSVERKLSITRACLEVLAERQVRAYLLTRSTLVLRDIEVLARIPRATVGFSIPTDDDAVALAYEPHASRVSERLQALGLLRARGLTTMAVVQPILAMNLYALADRLAEVCDFVRVDVYRPDALGGARLESTTPGAPSPPEQEATALALREALRARSVRLWDGQVPP